jgi:GTP-binding protein HflX
MSAKDLHHPEGSGAVRSERASPEALEPERAFLVAVDIDGERGWSAEDSLEELASLVETAGGRVVGSMAQRRDAIHPLWYLGRGKAEALKQAKAETHFDMLVADDELSPRQQRSLEEALKVKVLDRSGIILDIFAQRAHTHEGRIQVELAQLEYQLPRLTRMWTHLSRMGGGIGTRRGPGETQLETDRRVLRERIKKTRARVQEVQQRRETAARARERRLLPTIAIVGYTNAGKSTLLNALVGEEAAAVEDMLFATLDPTARRVRLREGQTVIVSDTVGFIHKLPHQLVEAFQATLEEVTRADLLLEVVDLADAHAAEHRGTVQAVLDDLEAGHKPRIVVLNKADVLEGTRTGGGHDAVILPGGWQIPGGILTRDDRHVSRISALNGTGIDGLRELIATVLAELWVEIDFRLPYSAGELLSRVRERGTVEFDYGEKEIRVQGRVPPAMAAELRGVATAVGEGHGIRGESG